MVFSVMIDFQSIADVSESDLFLPWTVGLKKNLQINRLYNLLKQLEVT